MKQLWRLLIGSNIAFCLLCVCWSPVPAAVTQQILKISPNPDGGRTEENGVPKEHALMATAIRN